MDAIPEVPTSNATIMSHFGVTPDPAASWYHSPGLHWWVRNEPRARVCNNTANVGVEGQGVGEGCSRGDPEATFSLATLTTMGEGAGSVDHNSFGEFSQIDGVCQEDMSDVFAAL
ncbi:hypothetical protein HDU96_008759 [Phlyctochytrium bullatum]|nr:hypothetical protein HDU96_008759 [Phlyctochytrium bullatum]